MAYKLALINFKFSSINGKQYIPNFKDECETTAQPIIKSARDEIGQLFLEVFGGDDTQVQVCVYDNFATQQGNIDVIATKMVIPRHYGAIIGSVRFHRMDKVYSCNIDIEDQYSMLDETPAAYDIADSLCNSQVEQYCKRLDTLFKLNGQIERIPIIKRGRVSMPYFNVTSDERVIEYDFNKIVENKRTEFQDVKILQSPSIGKTLLLDGLQNLAESDEIYSTTIIERGNFDYTNKDVLILGGGDCGILHVLSKENCRFITMVEIDKTVVDLSIAHLQPIGKEIEAIDKSKYEIIYDDCLKVMHKFIEDRRKFDVIISDLTDMPIVDRAIDVSSSESIKFEAIPSFLKQVIETAVDLLRDEQSVIQTHASGSGNLSTLSHWEKYLEAKMLNYSRRSEYIPSYLEGWVFYRIWLKK